ncbi:hypothetical protein D9Q98_004993 [Chlorella vulgaris]|uniref:Amino acid transporter transmembrane domain-containing protein n=1 Tax=Chlorella vulgaris TaxID=3077 RepID=A0A9D4TNL6_CHLVU|nr:hypothetical protein D9Q98_004993 [Chlorella vulgaris]
MDGLTGDLAGLSQPLLPSHNTLRRQLACTAISANPEPAAQQLLGPPSGRVAAHVLIEELPALNPHSSLWDTSVNLTNAILGAGMLALPHAYAGLGVSGGVLLTAAVGAMTHASIALMLRPTERSGKLTYAAVMEAEWGRWAGAAVRFSIVVGSAGFLVLYLIILADLLVGSEEFSGIIPDLWPGLPDPLPWFLQRTAVLTWVTLLVAPSLLPQTLGEVALISATKILCTVICVAALVVLAVALLIQGRLPQVHWLPDPAFFGDGAWTRLRGVLAVVPVIMTAFVCHMSIHPCVQDLRQYSPSRMRRAVAASLSMAGTVYALTGVAGLCVWGSAVKGDVLSNLNIDFVAAALWGNVPLACGFVATVKVAMAASMVLSFPITIWPMRQDIIEMLADYFGSRQLTQSAYYLLTYLSLLAIYVVAISIQSAYRVVGLVGSTMGTTIAFVFPGMLALRDQQGGLPFRVFGCALIATGLLLTVVGVLSTDDG